MEPSGDLQRASALWRPAWYSLDPPLAVGRREEYWFRAPTPNEVLAQGYDLLFYGGTPFLGEFEIRDTSILFIYHAELGELRRVETELDYEVELIDGRTLQIDAEGASRLPPGLVYNIPEGIEAPTTWDLTISIEVGPPMVDHPLLSRGEHR